MHFFLICLYPVVSIIQTSRRYSMLTTTTVARIYKALTYKQQVSDISSKHLGKRAIGLRSAQISAGGWPRHTQFSRTVFRACCPNVVGVSLRRRHNEKEATRGSEISATPCGCIGFLLGKLRNHPNDPHLNEPRTSVRTAPKVQLGCTAEKLAPKPTAER
ncbi:hypothetical protein EI94DRAFT_835051 [Lactarius quietus]|nr:hypothetical protein EI94DRAFT_835051 [Lactarius quietus]